MLTKDKNDITPDSTEGDKNDPVAQHWNERLNQPAIKDEDRNTNSPAQDIAKKEGEAEGKSPLKNTDNNPEKSWYNQNFADNASLLGRTKNAFALASGKKKAAGFGGLAAIIIGVVAFFSFLSTFQLIHIAEALNNVFDGQTRRVTSRRASLHYRLALDGTYFEKTGVTGRLAKGYASLDPKVLIDDLKTKGYIVSLDSSGKVTINGEILDGKVKAQRDRLGTVLNDAYPQDGWAKRYARTRTAFRAMGIKRVFFENTKQKVANREIEMIGRLRQRLTGDASVRVSGIGAGDADDADAEAEAEKLRADLEDPNYSPDPVASTVDAESINGFKMVGNSALNAVRLDGFGATLCEAKYYLKGVELAAIVVRHRALIAHAETFMVAAHQLKTGEGVSAAQVGALMTILNRSPGIGASGSYQLLSGNKDAKVKNADEIALSFDNTGGFGGTISSINKNLDETAETIEDYSGIPIESYCKLTRNIFYQVGNVVAGVGLLVLSVIGSPFTGGGTGAAGLAKTVAQVAFAGTIQVLKAVVRPYLIRNMAGPGAIINYGEHQKGDLLMDALIGGQAAQTSGSRYQGGMTQSLSSQQVAEIENAIALEKNEKAKNNSVFTKYFAIGNTDSWLSKQLAVLPSTPTSAAKSATNNIASLPKNFVSAISLFTPQGRANAAIVEGNPYLTQNPLSIPMYGMTDATIDEINTVYSDPIENEQWIYDNGGLAQYQEWVNECYPEDDPTMLYGIALDEDKSNTLIEKCSIPGASESGEAKTGDQERYTRYATYRLDRGIQQGILFMSEKTDCMDPDVEDWDCPFVDENTGSTSLNEVSVEPQTIEFQAFDLTKLLEKYTTTADLITSINNGKGLNFSDNSCDNAWNNETINKVETPIDWSRSTHFCWPSSVHGKGWYPQGISGSSSTSEYPAVSGRNLLITSWYSTENETGYAQSRRADENNTAEAEVNKLVVVDVDNQKYQEIELVAPCTDDSAKLCALGIHAGGVAWLGQKIIVAYGYGFYSFDLSNLRTDADGRYILPSSGRWKGVGLATGENEILISSSASVDKGAKQIVSANWSSSDPLRVYRWNLNAAGTDFASEARNTSVNHEISTAVGVQGIASDNGITFANSSNADGDSGGIGGALYYWRSFQSGNATGRRMPSGVVEGLYIDSSRDKIWSLTEHGTYAGERENYVFSFPLSSVVNSIGTPSDDRVPPATVNPSLTTNSSGGVFIDGAYAWPTSISKQYAANNNEGAGNTWSCNALANGCHHNGEPAVDIFDTRTNVGNYNNTTEGYTVGQSVFAITTGRMEQSHIYQDISGCYSFHIKGDDGYDYYYTHIKNPIISGDGKIRTVQVGEKIAEIGERKCTGNDSLPHLHIERAKKGMEVTGVNPISYRDPELEDLIVELHNRLPN